jgi:hypothetical protein
MVPYWDDNEPGAYQVEEYLVHHKPYEGYSYPYQIHCLGAIFCFENEWYWVSDRETTLEGEMEDEDGYTLAGVTKDTIRKWRKSYELQGPFANRDGAAHFAKWYGKQQLARMKKGKDLDIEKRKVIAAIDALAKRAVES